ncbi:MAG: hypothetical protein ACI4BH_00260 [Muribaculaceae bacterium]
MNNSFSISRFALLLKKDFTENIRLYAIGSVSLLLGLATLMVIFTPLMCMPAEEGGAIFATFPIYWLFSFALCIAASMMFSQLRTKQGRVSMFMLPATNSEKYLEQIFTNIICFALMFLACIFAAEGIRMVVAPWVWSDNVSIAINAGEYIDHFNVVYPTEMAMVRTVLEAAGISSSLFMWLTISGIVCNLGVFTLGAVLWPKYSFIKTYVAIYVCEIALFILMAIGANLFSTFDLESYISTQGMFITLIALLGVGGVAAFVASYILFTRKKVIS